MKIVTRKCAAKLSAEARENPRLRKNLNFHPSDESRCHRLLNAIEPESYVRPHRHLDPEKDEAFILISGVLGVVTFTDAGTVAETVLLSHAGGTCAVDIPYGVYHTALSLESGTVFYEAKAGPYRQLTADEMAPWAPKDSDPHAQMYLRSLQRLFD